MCTHSQTPCMIFYIVEILVESLNGRDSCPLSPLHQLRI
jgi:hypothetical protein